jgi:predicted CXXCH cytochrome family protein
MDRVGESAPARRNIAIVVVLIVVGLLAYGIAEKQRKVAAYDEPPAFVGRQSCVECHQDETEAWTGSHHDLAMQPATDETIVGDFNDAEFTAHGITSRFFRRDGKFFVNTEGPDGKLADFEVTFTFGVTPLQQYLISFGNGRLQCLTIAWDAEKKQWYHLYPNEKIASDDWLHWTRGAQSWNTMCADCHSTDLKKNYDVASDSFKTDWKEIDVSCESCHGPASRHVEWARGGTFAPEDPDKGFQVHFPAAVDPQAEQRAQLNVPGAATMVDNCARCHARRTQITEGFVHGETFMDHYVPDVLREGLYHADGQILDEVYVYGSFTQSKMYQVGVRCTNCHDAHSLKLKKQGNQLCTQCHEPAKYDMPTHHFHAPETESAQCVSCHMPGRTYMGIDFRRDHSLRVPRPDLSVKYGTPNACNGCHDDQKAEWAAEWVTKWYGETRVPHYSETLALGHTHQPGAVVPLAKLAANAQHPAIARATAVYELRHYPGADALEAISNALNSEEPLVRYYALGGLDRLPPRTRVRLASPLFTDSVRAVRLAAANLVADVDRSMFTKSDLEKFDAALAEYRESLRVNGDFPGGQMNIGLLERRTGNRSKAKAAYEQALKFDNRFNAARVNLAHIYNAEGRNKDAEALFRTVIEQEPQFGDAYYSLALLLAEEKRVEESAELLKKASELMPTNGRVAYNYAVALHQLQRMADAELAYLKAHKVSPASPDIVNGLVIFYFQQEKWAEALRYAEILARLVPQDPGPAQLIQQIRSKMQ